MKTSTIPKPKPTVLVTTLTPGRCLLWEGAVYMVLNPENWAKTDPAPHVLATNLEDGSIHQFGSAVQVEPVYPFLDVFPEPQTRTPDPFAKYRGLPDWPGEGYVRDRRGGWRELGTYDG